LACHVLLVVPLLKSSAFEHCLLERVEVSWDQLRPARARVEIPK
jgi:hypothetical protein